MAEGFAHQAGWESYSAGTKPETVVNPFAVKVMKEIGIDISHKIPKLVNEYLDHNLYIIATICDNAHETCPVFTGNFKHQIHHNFKDPADAIGSDEEISQVYRKIRDEIREWINLLTQKHLNHHE